MLPILKFEAVSKRYRSLLGMERWALKDFSLEMGAGEIVGFLGPMEQEKQLPSTSHWG